MIHVGDIGVQIELAVTETGTPVDLTTAQDPELRLRDPDGLTSTRPATVVSGNRLRYLTDDGDLDKEGQWELRGHFTLGAWSGHTTAFRVTVSPVD